MTNMQESEKKPDRRVIKTKKAIKNAFAQLLTEKDINDITISDIAEYADVNRKTFYNYYAGVFAVVDEIENDIVERFSAMLAGIDFESNIKNPYIVFEKLTAVINTDIDFFGILLSMNGNVSLVTKIVELIKEKAREALIATVSIEEWRLDIMLDFAISGMISVYQQWFNSDRRQSIEEISEIIGTMCHRGLEGVVGEAVI